MFALETLIKAGAATGDGYGPAPCRRSNRGNIVSTSYTTSRDRVMLKAGALSNTPNGSWGMIQGLDCAPFLRPRVKVQFIIGKEKRLWPYLEGSLRASSS